MIRQKRFISSFLLFAFVIFLCVIPRLSNAKDIMIKRQFSLQPFSVNNLPLNIEIKANTIYDAHKLSINYQVFGDINKIQIPSPVKIPARKDGLWEETCFEFFLGVINSPAYWEFNLSPSGNWNVYSFSNYREGMKKETTFTSLPFEFEQKSDHLSLKIKVNLDTIINNPQDLQIAITTVIKDKDNNISYWALKHTGDNPDFHRRDSFVNLT
jgi:hypothetical protein